MNLKKGVLIVVVSMFYFSVFAERQKVYSFIKQEHSESWYKEQASLWKSYLTTHKQDADAWLNYYTAKRMIRVSGGHIDKKDLAQIVEDAKRAVPNTFEYHYMVFWDADFNKLDENFYHLEKAYALAPERSEIFDDFLTYYEVKRNKQKLKEVAKKWFASNDIAPGLYYWNYNVLQSVEQDAILISSGDNDTYPALVAQYGNGVRTDVKVLNHSLLGVSSYRNLYFKELGIPTFEKIAEDYESYPSYQVAILEHLYAHANRPIYFSISAQPKLYEKFKKDIYNVGMAYKWSKTKFDNIAVTRRNYEKNYLLDYLKFDASYHISKNVVEHMNANYLISLLPLYNHYKESGDARSEGIMRLIERVAKKCNMEAKVNKILRQSGDKR